MPLKWITTAQVDYFKMIIDIVLKNYYRKIMFFGRAREKVEGLGGIVTTERMSGTSLIKVKFSFPEERKPPKWMDSLGDIDHFYLFFRCGIPNASGRIEEIR